MCKSLKVMRTCPSMATIPTCPQAPLSFQCASSACWLAGGQGELCASCFSVNSQEVYQNPDAQKTCVLVAITLWLLYLALVARATLHDSALLRVSGSTNLVAAFGIALPAMLWQMGRTFPIKRGFPAVETMIVACMTTYTGLLPMQSMLLLNALFFGVRMANYFYARPHLYDADGAPFLKDLCSNVLFVLPSCFILCLARNRIFPLPSNKAPTAGACQPAAAHSYSTAASALAAPAALSITGMVAALAASACLPTATTGNAANEWAASDVLAVTLHAALAAVAAAMGTAMVSAATTAWLPPGTGALERWMKSPRFAALWANCGLAEAHPVPPSQCFISRLVFPEWLQRGGKWLLDAVPQGPAETMLAALAALDMGIHFTLFVMSFMTNSDVLWSPTHDILCIFAGITLGSSQGQHLHNLSCAQQRMYRSAASLLRGVIPEHIVDAMMLRSLTQASEEQEEVQMTPAVSFTSVSSDAEHHFALADWGREAASEGGQAQNKSLGTQLEHRSSLRAPNLMPRKSLSSWSLLSGARRLLRVSALGGDQSTDESLSRHSHSLDERPSPMHSSLSNDKQGAFLERHEDVTIVFVDLVGFTALSEQITPHEVMCLLGDLYRKYDELAAKLKLYTLDTIGDCYMCAANLIPPLEGHVDTAVGFAQSVIEITSRVMSPLGKPLSVRVGLHTGPVIAGILGYHRFKFTTVGDTVNIASRLQTSAPPDAIQISEHCFSQLRRPEIPAMLAAAAASASSSGLHEGAFMDSLVSCLLPMLPRDADPPQLSGTDEHTKSTMQYSFTGEQATVFRARLRKSSSGSPLAWEGVGFGGASLSLDAASALHPRSKSVTRQAPASALPPRSKSATGQAVNRLSNPLVLSPPRARCRSTTAAEKGEVDGGGAGSSRLMRSSSISDSSGSCERGRHDLAAARGVSLSRLACASPTLEARAVPCSYESTQQRRLPPRFSDTQAQPHHTPSVTHSVTPSPPPAHQELQSPHHTGHHTCQDLPQSALAAGLSGASQAAGMRSACGQCCSCSGLGSDRSNEKRASVAGEVRAEGEGEVYGPLSAGALPECSMHACSMKCHHPWACSVIDVKGKGKMRVFCFGGSGSSCVP